MTTALKHFKPLPRLLQTPLYLLSDALLLPRSLHRYELHIGRVLRELSLLREQEFGPVHVYLFVAQHRQQNLPCRLFCLTLLSEKTMLQVTADGVKKLFRLDYRNQSKACYTLQMVLLFLSDVLEEPSSKS